MRIQELDSEASNCTSSSSAGDLPVFALTLINKTLYGVPDQDAFFDHADHLEEQGMEALCQRLVCACAEEASSSSSPDEQQDHLAASLLQQVQLYNVALKQEDGEAVTEADIRYGNRQPTKNQLEQKEIVVQY